MRLVFTIIFFILVFQGGNTFAQAAPPAANAGCIVGNILYTDYRGTIKSGKNFRHRFYSSPSYNLNCNQNAISYYQNLGTAQQSLDNQMWEIGCGTGSNYGGLNGIMYYYSLVLCPLDDYVPIALMGAGGIGFLFLRNRFLSI